jgi:pSer/pThr/pTyr-binding forkhead associated (FHA) protein
VTDRPLERFWEACAAVAPLTLTVRSPDGLETPRVLEQPFAVLGRASHLDVALDDPDVSRRHLYIQVVAGRLFCVDLKSRTGMRWDDRSAPHGWLHAGQPLTLGRHQVLAPAGLPDRPSDWDPLATDWPGEPLPSLSLSFRNTAQRPWCQLRRVVTLVGSAPPCKVRLRSSLISRVDCALVRTPSGVWLVDLLGRGEVRLNGVRVRLARLEDRDRLELGEFQIRIHCEPGAGGAPPISSQAGPSSLPALCGNQIGLPRGAASNPAAPLVPAPRASGERRAEAALPVGLHLQDVDSRASPVLALVNQFGTFQQQMFEQFHQALLAMSQMFGALHQDQTQLLREELERLRDVTEELRLLKAGMATAPAAPPDRPAPGAATARSNGCAPPSSGTSRAPGSPALTPVPDVGSAGKTTPIPAGSSAPPEKSVHPDQAEDVHALLCQRLAALQEERQSRWQRVLGLLSGKGTGGGKS